MENEADEIARHLRNVESDMQVHNDRLLRYKIRAFELITGEIPMCIGCGTEDVSMLRDVRNYNGALSGTVWSCSQESCMHGSIRDE